MRFGDYIMKLRESVGMSQAHAARELGMSAQRLCDIERGRRNFVRPPTQLLKKIALVYDHPFSSLLQNSEFFTYEKSIITDLLTDIEPAIKTLEQKTMEMAVEARQYTPEMEALATEAMRLTRELQLSIAVVKKRFSKGARAAP